MPSKPPQIRWITFRNDSGETVPAYAVIRITGVGDEGSMGFVLTADKPNEETDSYRYYVNSGLAVAADTYGKCTEAMSPIPVLIDESEGDLEFGQEVGPEDDEWKVTSEGEGFIFLGYFTDAAVFVTKQSGGGHCEQNEQRQISFNGTPTGGSWVMTLVVNGVSSNLTVPYNASATSLRTLIEGHSEVGAGNVTVTGTGSSFPGGAMLVEFTGDLANQPIGAMIQNVNGLTGGTGVGVHIVRIQKGAGA